LVAQDFAPLRCKAASERPACATGVPRGSFDDTAHYRTGHQAIRLTLHDGQMGRVVAHRRVEDTHGVCESTRLKVDVTLGDLLGALTEEHRHKTLTYFLSGPPREVAMSDLDAARRSCTRKLLFASSPHLLKRVLRNLSRLKLWIGPDFNKRRHRLLPERRGLRFLLGACVAARTISKDLNLAHFPALRVQSL
jgi:hypothetical protein